MRSEKKNPVCVCVLPSSSPQEKENCLLKKIVEFLSLPLFVHFHFIFVDWVWIIEMVRKLFLFHFVFIFSPEKEEENVPKFYYFMTWWVMCVCRMKVSEKWKKSKILLGCGKKIVWKLKFLPVPKRFPLTLVLIFIEKFLEWKETSKMEKKRKFKLVS